MSLSNPLKAWVTVTVVQNVSRFEGSFGYMEGKDEFAGTHFADQVNAVFDVIHIHTVKARLQVLWWRHPCSVHARLRYWCLFECESPGRCSWKRRIRATCAACSKLKMKTASFRKLRAMHWWHSNHSSHWFKSDSGNFLRMGLLALHLTGAGRFIPGFRLCQGTQWRYVRWKVVIQAFSWKEPCG